MLVVAFCGVLGPVAVHAGYQHLSSCVVNSSSHTPGIDTVTHLVRFDLISRYIYILDISHIIYIILYAI